MVIVRPIGYNESTVVRIRSKCRCSCGPTKHCNDEGQSACSGLRDGTSQERQTDSGLVKDSNGDPNQSCRPDGSDMDCSGRGVCECGRCVCEQSKLGAVYGRYCEVDDFSCSYEGGVVCGGEAGGRQPFKMLTRKCENIPLFVFHLASVCLSQAEVCVCPVSVCVPTAGPETAAAVPPPRPAVNQPTA